MSDIGTILTDYESKLSKFQCLIVRDTHLKPKNRQAFLQLLEKLTTIISIAVLSYYPKYFINDSCNVRLLT